MFVNDVRLTAKTGENAVSRAKYGRLTAIIAENAVSRAK